MMVDMYGNVQLCFNMRYLTAGEHLGNVRDRDPGELWRSERATEFRGLMSGCRKTCGMLNCHMRQ